MKSDPPRVTPRRRSERTVGWLGTETYVAKLRQGFGESVKTAAHVINKLALHFSTDENYDNSDTPARASVIGVLDSSCVEFQLGRWSAYSFPSS
jgi:hypothetical protein